MKRYWTEIKAFILLFVIFIFVLLLDIAVIYFYYQHVDKFINSQPKNLKADTGILFFGDYTKDATDIGSHSKNRANTVINLFNTGKINNIICVGGYYYRTWQGKPHHMSNYLIRKGIPPNVISNDSLSFNTITNWYEGRKIMTEKKYKSAIIVSDPLHLYRISMMIKDTNIFYASYQYKFTRFSDYWVFFKDVHHEFMSHLMSVLFHDKLRNQMVLLYRKVMLTAKKIF
jgi:uncharacterized SAM-binding protein YcdF (DUF218 family)